MTLVLNRAIPPGQNAVHALIVAVGEYPYLGGGSADEKFQGLPGVGQLSSPPVSARCVLDWLRTDYTPYESSLATVEVLCSGEQEFLDDGGTPIAVERARLPNLRAAVARWHERGNVSEDDTLLFLFCGHGVASGAITSLLLEEFGDNPLDPFSTGAVAADEFMTGMRACKALRQLYLMDACRYSPADYFAEFGESTGVPLVRGAMHTNLGRSRQVCIWASKLGKSAYGRPGQSTIFTDAWLASMRGASARQDEATDSWVVQGTALAEGINAFIKRSQAADRQFATPGIMTEGFAVHVLAGLPVVPVNVICRPPKRYGSVDLRCAPGNYNASGPSGPWHLELVHGSYNMTAHPTGADTVLDSRICIASPPSAIVSMYLENPA